MPVSGLRQWRRDETERRGQLAGWRSIVVVPGAFALALTVAACTRTVTHEKASGGYVGYDTDSMNPNGMTAGGATFNEEPPNTGPSNYEGSQEAKVSFN